MQSNPEANRRAVELLHRVETDLRGNILPFWMRHAVHHSGSGFVGALTNDLVEDPKAERGLVLTARILWTYAAAYREYRYPAYLRMAHLARGALDSFQDREHGGYWWSLGPYGIWRRERKQIYGQAFAIYALAEYYDATGSQESLDAAADLFRLIEHHARDRRSGGYLEAFAPDWRALGDVRLSEADLNAPRSQNTHLHLLEAYTRLLRSWPDPALRRALAELLELMMTRIVDWPSGHLGLFFTADWQPLTGRISYGHDIEASWLFVAAAEALPQVALGEHARLLAVRMAEATLAEGVNTDGGLYNEGDKAGPSDRRKEWWPQAEAVVGFVNAWELSGDDRFLRAAANTWAFIEERLIDRRHGEWFRGVTREGEVLPGELKVGFWKCPYHNSRAGLEIVRRLRRIVAGQSHHFTIS